MVLMPPRAQPPLPAAATTTATMYVVPRYSSSSSRGLLRRCIGRRGATAALVLSALASSVTSGGGAAAAAFALAPSSFFPLQAQQRQQRWAGNRAASGGSGRHLNGCWAWPFRIGQYWPAARNILTTRGAARMAAGDGEGRRWRRAEALLVTSADNGKVKRMKALGKKKKERERENLVLLEGHRLLLDAAEAGHAPTHVLVCPEAFDAPRGGQLQLLLETLPASCVTLCTASLVASACDTVSPQGVVAVIPRPSFSSSPYAPSPSTHHHPPLCLVLDGMQDPGNVGTLVRTAVACGVSEVMLVQGCDPWSPKALRSAMGATFKAPCVSEASDWEAAKTALRARHGAKLQFVAADGGEALPDYDSIDWTGPSVLVVGNEGNGLCDAVRTELAGGKGVKGGRIPLAGGVESLNAGAAGAIILAEAARQRRQKL